MIKITIEINNCLECPNHRVIADPDPYDWFCDDDKAIVCTKVPNDEREIASEYLPDRQEYKVVACSIRPHKLEKEARIPHWCPYKIEEQLPK